MPRILTLPEITSALDNSDPGWEFGQSDWRASVKLEERVTGIMRQACAMMRCRGESDAMDFLRAGARELGFMPLALAANIIRLAQRLHREPEAVEDCLECGRQACAQGYDDLGLEACTAGMMLDTQGDYAVTKSPARSRALADIYESVAGRLITDSSSSLEFDVSNLRFKMDGEPVASRLLSDFEPSRARRSKPLRVGLVVSNLVDHVAYTKTAAHFARHHDRDRYALKIYSTENLAQRDRHLFPFGGARYRSEETGVNTIALCRELGVPVFLNPRDLVFTAAVHCFIRQTVADGMDILIFQSGLACPIDWLAARLAPAPVKLAINIGSFMFNAGLTATFYDNPVNIAREREYADPHMGDRLVLRQGTDLDSLARQPGLRRADFGIPDDAVILGVMSNHLARRLSVPCMQIIANLLAKNSRKVWFVAFGARPPAAIMNFFKQHGVLDRVVFAGCQIHAGAALKLFDIYLNEFPVGGSQSVIEAMACGVPAVAMRWSEAHAECAGAEAVGPEFAVPSADPAAYEALVQKWIDDPAARAAAGRAMRRRAQKEYSVAQYIEKLLKYAAKC